MFVGGIYTLQKYDVVWVGDEWGSWGVPPSLSTSLPSKSPQNPAAAPHAPKAPPAAATTGGRAPAPRGHHPNSYNQQPRQDFKLTQYPAREKHKMKTN